MTAESRFPSASKLILLLLPALVVDCGSGGNPVCAPGISIPCACSDGRTGAQACNASGSGYGVCECTATGTGGASGGTGGTMTSTGGSGGRPAGGAGGGGAAGSGLGGTSGGAGGASGGAAGKAGTGGAGGTSGGAGGVAGKAGTGGATGSGGVTGQGGSGGAAGQGGGAGAGTGGTAGTGAGGSATGGAAGSSDGGAGSGLFALAAVYGFPGYPADVDGDGVVDLVGGTSPSGPVSVWKGRGDGTYVLPPVVTSGSLPPNAIYDWNGDGRADLPDIGGAGPSGTIYFGQSDETFAAGPTWAGLTAQLPDQPPSFCGVGRFNGPASWELLYVGYSIVGTSSPRLIYADRVQITQSSAGLVAGGQTTFNNLNPGSRGGVTATLGVGDFDKDGNPDFAFVMTSQGQTGTATTNPIIVYGNGDGTFRSTMTTVPNPSTSSLSSGRVIDIDGDGLSDLALWDGTPACQVVWNRGGGTFTAPGSSVPCPAYDSGSNAVGDFDGDGVNDILTYNGQVHPLQWYILFGDGSRGYGRRLDIPIQTSGVVWAFDVNNDGAMDLVFPVKSASLEPSGTYVYLSTAKTPAPASPDVQCDMATLGSLCTPPARF
ncbi:MAG TPA: VCBS repeat-containing protein [Polyangia bacterium]|nr:VCBS repeat-containing protein [Polyangia bacterium]